MRPDLFYDTLRNSPLFGGKLAEGVVDTLRIITDTYYAEYLPTRDPEHLAYILATAYHESFSFRHNPDWKPIREGYAKTNAAAIRHVAELRMTGAISKNYALPNRDGKSFYGRGWVQTTHERNYLVMGKRIGLDLVSDPDLLLQPGPAAKALVIGSVEGLYTGKILSDYDTPDGMLDAFNVRRVINGLDKAEKIKGDYEIFHLAVSRAIAG